MILINSPIHQNIVEHNISDKPDSSRFMGMAKAYVIDSG